MWRAVRSIKPVKGLALGRVGGRVGEVGYTCPLRQLSDALPEPTEKVKTLVQSLLELDFIEINQWSQGMAVRWKLG
jgi:hypothetical protein